jgi:hypothetical protein
MNIRQANLILFYIGSVKLLINKKLKYEVKGKTVPIN